MVCSIDWATLIELWRLGSSGKGAELMLVELERAGIARALLEEGSSERRARVKVVLEWRWCSIEDAVGLDPSER